MSELSTNPDQLVVEHNAAQRQFEIRIAGHAPAVLTYALTGNTLNLLHAGTPKELEGRGIAGRITKHALRENKLRVIPTCPYVAAYIKRHPEYEDLVGSIKGSSRP
jgi:predicted GNAT family acetyltransferase